MNFKVGDRVIGNEGASRYTYTHTGWKGTVVSIDPFQVDHEGISLGVDASCFDLLKSKSIMSKLTTMFKNLVDADTQVLRKAGFINGDLDFTDEGRLELMAILFLANKAALVDVAKTKVAAEEK